jgi:methylmalonyl-CoA mutase
MSGPGILGDFPPVSTDQWEKVIREDLNYEDFAKRLVWVSDEGLQIQPYYRAEDTASLDLVDASPGTFPYIRGNRSTGDWRIREEINISDPVLANHAARVAVAAGAEEIAFGNVAVECASDLVKLQDNLGGVPVHFGSADEPLILHLMQMPQSAAVSTDWDPLSNASFAAEAINSSQTPITFSIDAAVFEETGATAVQEIGFALAAAVEFLAEMQARKVVIDRSADSVNFSFAIGSNYFLQIAKLRAFRMLWARVVESFGGSRESARARIHARTSRWNKTIYDPHVNILRGTTEAMSAAIGGADSISVEPFDACCKAPDAASRRLARNTQILLKQEAGLSRMSDPGGGSYYLEVLTDFLAREAWKSMQGIEASGGYRKAQANGAVSQALAASLAIKEKAVALRQRAFIGTNRNVNLSEKAYDRIDISRVTQLRRGSHIYERLRLRTERHVAQGGKLPRVLLAEIGDVKISTARSAFASDFFGCAGFDPAIRRFEGVDPITATEADLVVLCSSDAEYPSLIASLMAKMTEPRRKVPVIIAGYPDSMDQLEAAGVEDFVNIRSNPVDVLAKWQLRFGIKD